MVMAAAYLFAFLLRLNFQEPWWGWAGVTTSFITVWVVQWLAFFAFRCDRLLWRYISVRDVPRFMGVVASASLVLIGLRVWFPSSHGFRPPFGIIIINSIAICYCPRLAIELLLVPAVMMMIKCENTNN